MPVVLLCIAIPIAVLALFAYLRSQYGDVFFTLDWPSQELNNKDDFRLIKLRLTRNK